MRNSLARPIEYENGEHEQTSDERRVEKIIIILNSVLPAKFLREWATKKKKKKEVRKTKSNANLKYETSKVQFAVQWYG